MEGDANEMFEDFDPNVDKDTPYAVGTHPQATLTNVETFAASDKGYGYRIGLHFDLKSDGKMPYKGRLDLPRTIEQNGDTDKYEWAQKKEAGKLEAINFYLRQFGSPRKLSKPIDTDEAYNVIASIFRQLVGNQGKVRIVADGKNVKDDAGNWKFEPNGFTKLASIGQRKSR